MDMLSESEDEVEDSSLSQPSQLDKFREEWHAELQSRVPSPFDNARSSSPVQKPGSSKSSTPYEKAKELFMNGVWAEKNGLVYEAMEYYRKATKIVPDIDIQMTALYRQSMAQTANVQESSETDRTAAELSEELDEDTDLCTRFDQLFSSNCNELKTFYCSMEKPQKSMHISALPGEILTYIFRWVVSSDVDARSLEQCAKVCRGFYVLARDPCIWHHICTRTWGPGCQSCQPYSTWRALFIEKPHLYYHGVYMNKVELFRQGESTLERYYPPWMKVVYYRYLRFFPDGVVFMLTSSYDPITVISQLRSHGAQVEGMCRGMYRMKENQISCILKRVKNKETKVNQRYKRNREEIKDSEMTFYLDLTLHGHGTQPNMVIKWEKYSVSIYHLDTQNESTSDFKLTKQDFPPFKFARVKSYATESTAPLSG
ncbi:FBXO9 [Bugula neritina]|uniref:FBXO9 n=1 Tax=Bugula neritina TaxID=10212 RepID=A0A7J7JQW9_BUGNE|nr:FBXO9 [Bugula neritina]